ncbi:DUF1206 domain-containing protein [Sphingomonas jatrophae]|uniref:DUF1206 domain-containing protein n=1 Tax=Sphingomonas jatrophae TaxID=1166337 RepID=A0A1I6KZZ3_9SPHN|nr:DUF1206 domain-containing protein [Sphingomonas jatrophae]SFR96500.1 protein of unknown function [Sphingomonas jatrophae]
MVDSATLAARATLLARLGFAARGLVYVLVGWFAIDAARGGGRPSDNQGAIASLAAQPLGHVLLALIALGLAGYAVWRFAEAAWDPEGIGRTAKGAFERAGHAVSGVAHVVLAIFAARLALRDGPSSQATSGDESARDWSQWIMEQPAGPFLVALVGICLFVVAAVQARKAATASFVKELSGNVPAPDYVRTAGRIGYTARAIVFAIVGWFFVSAGWASDADRAGGVAQALRRLQAQDHGSLLLGAVAAGLFLFGLYSFVEARFRTLRVKLPH